MMTPAPFRQLPDSGQAPARGFHVTAADGVRLRLALWQAAPDTDAGAARGTVLLFPGRTEYCEKYAPVARQLTGAGHAVLAIDWRGQGASDRLTGDPTLGHVEDFAHYQRDVAAMLDAAARLALPRPWNLLSHSMGGTIALRALDGGLDVRSAVFSAPMLDINLGRLPAAIGHGIATGLSLAAQLSGHGAHPVPGAAGVLHIAFSANRLTSDIGEYTRLMREAATWPELTIGLPTYTWLNAAIAEFRALETLPRPALPALISISGGDNVVALQPIRDLAASWPGSRLIEEPDARHEVMFETRPIRERFLASVLELFARP